MTTVCKHFIVSGKVQGVFYRDTARKKAQELQLTGWVRNKTDGSVELVACGAPSNLEKLADWLWVGPPAAKVSAVKSEDMIYEEHPEFVIRSS